jgi:hypothetical protein
VEGAVLHPGRGRDLDEVLAVAARGAASLPVDQVLIAPWGEGARARLRRWTTEAFRSVPVDDVTLGLGEALAATPALGWAAAIDRLASGDARRVVVVSAGIDGDLGVVTLAREISP